MATPTAPIILYDNILESATVTVTSEASGFPKENLWDYRTFTQWKPTSAVTQDIDIDYGSAVTCDAFALIGHDLGTRTASIEIFHDDNSGFTSATSVGTKSFTVDDPAYMSLTSGTDRYWRIRISSLSAACVIGHLALGAKLQMEHLPQDGFDLDAQQTRGKAFVSAKGNFLGAAVAYTQRSISAEFRYLTESWVQSSLLPFLTGHYLLLKPFFILPDPSNYSSRVYFLRAPDNPSIHLQSEGVYRHFRLHAIGLKHSDF